MARILLAEDNLKLRQLLRGLIEAHEGWYVCGETGDGLEAVSKLTEVKPDVVVLDFAMSRLNGLQVAVKMLNVCPGLPIILHTVHAFPAMIAEAKKAGIREVVAKSETAGQLLDVIEALLKENRPANLNASSVLPQTDLPGPETSPDEQKPPESN